MLEHSRCSGCYMMLNMLLAIKTCWLSLLQQLQSRPILNLGLHSRCALGVQCGLQHGVEQSPFSHKPSWKLDMDSKRHQKQQHHFYLNHSVFGLLLLCFSTCEQDKSDTKVMLVFLGTWGIIPGVFTLVFGGLGFATSKFRNKIWGGFHLTFFICDIILLLLAMSFAVIYNTCFSPLLFAVSCHDDMTLLLK